VAKPWIDNLNNHEQRTIQNTHNLPSDFFFQ